MTDSQWTWASLAPDQLGLLNDAERTLGVDYLLAYEAAQPEAPAGSGQSPADLEPAALNDSQLECLRGLEGTLNATVVAYRKSG